MFLAFTGRQNLAPEFFVPIFCRESGENDSASCLLTLASRMSSTSTGSIKGREIALALSEHGGIDLSDAQSDTGLNVSLPAETWRPRSASPVGAIGHFVAAVNRRWLRERRRRAVGRAYDMALEIARVIPRGSEVLDVGCGNGFIAHHLSALLGTSVVGIDLAENTRALIDYRRYDGAAFPVVDNSFDAVLLCYVLHHAQDVGVVVSEMRRALRQGGRAVIYEDIPQTLMDRAVCWIHNLQWRHRTGPCTFRREPEWRALFESCGFEIVAERNLSRWRNLTHPVCRRFYVLKVRPTTPMWF
jgi:SAM-dependent methyltransferase